MNDQPVIEVEGLTHHYGSHAALENVAFSVGSKEIFALLGPNGGGKTTVFRILATLLFPARGQARILGHDVQENPATVRKHIGVVFQSPSLDRKLTVRENLRHQGHLHGLRGKMLRQRIGNLLSRFGVAERADEEVEKLSGGLCRRVELAKGFLHSPQVLLLDEPSTSLDPGARRDLWEYLSALRETDGITILLTTHLMEEAERCDRLAILDRGRLVALGSPQSLKRSIGGDVIVLEAKDPAKLQHQIQGKFGGNPTVLDRTVRVERPQGHEFIARVMEAFPGQIDAVTLSKPTLEDVFIHQTGHRFRDENQDAARSA